MKLLKNITLTISLCTIFLLNAKQMGRNVTPAPVNYPQPQPTIQPIATPQNAAQGTYKWFLDKIKSMPDNQVFKSNNFLTDHALALVENIDHSALAKKQKAALKEALLYLHLSWTDNFENDQKRLKLIKEDAANRLELEAEPVIKKEPIQIPKPVKPVQPQPTQQSREAQLKKTQPETTIEIQPQTTIEEEEITNFIRGLLLQQDYRLRMAFGIEDKTMPYKFGNVERVLSDIINVIKQRYPQNMNMAQRILHENIFKNFRNKLLPSQEDEIHQYITNNLKAGIKNNTSLNPQPELKPDKPQPKTLSVNQQKEEFTQYINSLLDADKNIQQFSQDLANKEYEMASLSLYTFAAKLKNDLDQNSQKYSAINSKTLLDLLTEAIDQRFNLSKLTTGEYALVWELPIGYLLGQPKKELSSIQKEKSIPEQRKELTAFINQLLNGQEGNNLKRELDLKEYQKASVILEKIADRVRSELIYGSYTLKPEGALRILEPIVNQKFNLSWQNQGENYYKIWKDAEFMLE